MLNGERELTDFVEVEREVSGDGAVETSLEERRPRVTQHTNSAVIARTDARHARKHRLQQHHRHIIQRFGCVAQLAERRSLAGELTLSYAGPVADG